MITKLHPVKRLFGILAVLVFVGCSAEDAGQSEAAKTMPDAAEPSEVAPTSDSAVVEVRADNAMAGWLATGVELQKGDQLALFGTGTWDAQGISFEPRHAMWYRVGEQGNAINFAANQEVLSAPQNGELYLTLRPLGVDWVDSRGTYPEGFTDAPAVPAQISVQIFRLEGQVESALLTLAEQGNEHAQAALAAIEDRNTLPVGFDYLPYVGRSNVWANGTADGAAGIHASTSDDFGIVKKAVDVPLDANTTFSFDWLYQQLPARGPETLMQHHDYLSIALEFDNGQDLTWMWSAHLEEEFHFGCPLPWWDVRETHYVLQSGEQGLGSWHSHSRNVLADYEASIELPAPERIVGVWFIANSLFGRNPGAASFANATINTGDALVKVFE